MKAEVDPLRLLEKYKLSCTRRRSACCISSPILFFPEQTLHRPIGREKDMANSTWGDVLFGDPSFWLPLSYGVIQRLSKIDANVSGSVTRSKWAISLCQIRWNGADLSLASRSGQYMAPPVKDPMGNVAAGPSPLRLSRWDLTCSLYTMARPRKGPGSACSHIPALNAAS